MRTISRLRLFAAALLLTSAAPATVHAQAAPAPAAAPASSTSPSSASTYSGLPGDQEPAPPRTLRAYWHVWIAFSIAWLLLFGYVLSLGRRFGRLEQEIQRLG